MHLRWTVTASVLVPCLLLGVFLPAPTWADSIVLWNKLGSVEEVEDSAWGSYDGTVTGAGFTAGKFGGAYIADYSEDLLLSFPKEVVPSDRGCIDFWAKMTGFSGKVPWGGSPMFVYADDGTGTVYEVQFNGNNGGGQGGFCYSGGHYYDAATGSYTGTYTYEDLLGGDVEGWHHYALLWDVDKIEGYYEGKRELIAFIDGELAFSGSYKVREDDGFPPLEAGALWLVLIHQDYGAAAVDNLKIWDYPAFDAIEHRFEEDYIPEPGSLLLLGTAVLLGFGGRWRGMSKS